MKIDFENLINTRDLGGMKTKDGRVIKKGMLIRSGQLSEASANDKKRLSEMLNLIVDFRTTIEASEKPDPELDGVKYIHRSIFTESTEGISRDKKSDESAFGKLMQKKENAGTPLERMHKVYARFITDKDINARYVYFLNLVLGNDKGAVLWHCTAGKDRAGFASILIEYILGVDIEDIKADYLATNEFIKPEVEFILNTIAKGKTEEEKKEMMPFLAAEESYFDAIFDAAKEMYGSFDDFLEQAMGIGEKEIKIFRDKFTE